MRGSERNRPCPCGSGKKSKQCCSGRKPRRTALTLDFGEPVAPHRIEMLPTGEVRFFSHDGRELIPQTARLEKTYERPKGPKVLQHLPIDNASLSVNLNAPLYQFDRLYAIDTNTRTFATSDIAVSAVLLCRLSRLASGRGLALLDIVHLLEFHNVIGKPENVAWQKLCELLVANPQYNPTWRVGIIVDSDLTALSPYNARTLPIVAGYYLPRGFELLYASADSGKENFANLLISHCDAEARRHLDRVTAGEYGDRDLQAVEGQPYTHFRFWVR